jgi:hypothetical protein
MEVKLQAFTALALDVIALLCSNFTLLLALKVDGWRPTVDLNTVTKKKKLRSLSGFKLPVIQN